jgi:hypothetical protein
MSGIRGFLTQNSFWFLVSAWFLPCRNQKQYPAPFLTKFGFRNRPHGGRQTLDPAKTVVPWAIFRRSRVKDNDDDPNKNPN